MGENLEIYDLKGKYLGSEERSKFYSEIKDEFKKNKKISKKVKTIRLLLMNSDGRIYLQKRSKIKDENAGLYDKTVGGHVNENDSFDLTAIRECAEELGFPIAIVSGKEFEKAANITDTQIIGIFKQIEILNDFISKRIDKTGSVFKQPFITAMYIGYFDGAIRFVDGESSGIEVFSIDELKEEIKSHPQNFTEDIKYMIKRYEKYIKPRK
jgi:8-oxo-dGTP pyrophosphatase MutT (NUDIX family)